MRVSEFAEYGNRISSPLIGPTGQRFADHEVHRWPCCASPVPRHLAELSWRLGLALAALNCVIIALAATRVNPRVGRSAGLVFALFAFASYYNLLSVGQSWIGRGRIGLGLFMLLLHGGILLLALGLAAGCAMRDWRLGLANAHERPGRPA
jgi:lipopolysaccharide export system permease protein